MKTTNQPHNLQISHYEIDRNITSCELLTSDNVLFRQSYRNLYICDLEVLKHAKFITFFWKMYQGLTAFQTKNIL